MKIGFSHLISVWCIKYYFVGVLEASSKRWYFFPSIFKQYIDPFCHQFHCCVIISVKSFVFLFSFLCYCIKQQEECPIYYCHLCYLQGIVREGLLSSCIPNFLLTCSAPNQNVHSHTLPDCDLIRLSFPFTFSLNPHFFRFNFNLSSFLN